MNYPKKISRWTVVHRNLTSALSVFAAFLFVATASAQISTGIPPLANAGAATTLLCNILNAMFWVLLSVSIIMILWGAFLYITAGDDVKKPSEARMTILYALIGIVIALSAKGFPLIVANLFPGASVKGCGS